MSLTFAKALQHRLVLDEAVNAYAVNVEYFKIIIIILVTIWFRLSLSDRKYSRRIWIDQGSSSQMIAILFHFFPRLWQMHNILRSELVVGKNLHFIWRKWSMTLNQLKGNISSFYKGIFFSITFSLRRVILKFKSIENREIRQLLLHRLATSKHSAMLFLEQ